MAQWLTLTYDPHTVAALGRHRGAMGGWVVEWLWSGTVMMALV